MLQYRKILELHFQGQSMRNISASTGNSRPKVSEIIQMATEKGIAPPLAEEIIKEGLDHYDCRYDQKTSDSQLYKQAGNSVTVSVIYFIAKHFKIYGN